MNSSPWGHNGDGDDSLFCLAFASATPGSGSCSTGLGEKRMCMCVCLGEWWNRTGGPKESLQNNIEQRAHIQALHQTSLRQLISASPFIRVFPGFSFRPQSLCFPSRPFAQCNSKGRQMTINLQPSFPVARCWDGIVCAQHGRAGRAVPGCRKGQLFSLIVTQGS